MYPLSRSLSPLGRGHGALFSPTDIAGLKLWRKADSGLFQNSDGTVAAAVGDDPVGYQTDYSGQNNHPKQTTSGRRPLLKLNIQNGLPALLYDGVDDYLQTNTFTLTDPVYHVIVFRSHTRTNNTTIWDGKGTVNSGRFYYQTATSGQYGMEGRTGGATTVTGVSDGTTGIYVIGYNGTSSKWQLNGGTLNNAPSMTAANPGGITIASAGDIRLYGKFYDMEHLVYSAVLTTQNITDLLVYLNAKWAIY